MKKIFAVLMACLVTVAINGCAKVGSESWCADLKEKPKGEWTANEASDFAKHCIFK